MIIVLDGYASSLPPFKEESMADSKFKKLLKYKSPVSWCHDDVFPIDSAFVSAVVIGFAFVMCASQWSGVENQKKPKK